jgi:hypothetical protein
MVKGMLRAQNAEDDLDEGTSDNTQLWMCYFGSSIITVGKIKEMEEKGYFPKGEARTPGAEIVLEPSGNEAIMYKDFLIAGLCMPRHPALADILLHFYAQLNQLTSNAIAQLSKILGSR